VARDLLTDPAWREADLGDPLPDSLHACSMALPTWDAVTGYEEQRDKVMRRLRAGYPRFFLQQPVARLLEAAKSEVAADGEDVLLFPTKASVQRAHRWVESRTQSAVRITSYHGLQALVVPEAAMPEARNYWRFCGEIVSSRRAADLLDDTLRDDSLSAEVAQALCRITGADAGHTFVFASGMAAVSAVLRALPGIHKGLKTLQIEFPYVDCLKIQEHFGNGVVYLNEADGESFDEALMRIRMGEFAGVFTEAPGNPLLRTADLARIADACRDGGTPLVIDDSACGPANVDALRFADIVTGSLTKWISGAGDVIAGAATLRADSSFAETMHAALAECATHGAPLYAADAQVLLSNMAGYPFRNDRINANALALTAWLADHPAVARVWHPSITTTDHYHAVRRDGGGHGGLLSFVLKQPKKTARVYDALPLCKGPGFGTPFTLVCPYTRLAHYHELDWAEACGVSPHLLRVSCGLEPAEVLIAAFETALQHA